MFNIGRVCVKIAGRDAGKRCVVVDVIDEKNVLVDGETRRRKTNINHLEPTEKVVELEKGVDTDTVRKAVEELGWTITERKPKQKRARPRKVRKSAEKAAETGTVAATA